MKEDKDIYVLVEESIGLMEVIHLLWWNTSLQDTRMNDAITITIM